MIAIPRLVEEALKARLSISAGAFGQREPTLPDITAISGALSSLKASSDIAKALLGIRDAQLIREKAVELTSEIISAHQSALAAQAAQLALIEEARELKRQISELEDWSREKQRYELTEIAPGCFAYELKKSADTAEPAHRICAACYQSRRKSILQTEVRARHMHKYDVLVCHVCEAEMIVKSEALKIPPIARREI